MSLALVMSFSAVTFAETTPSAGENKTNLSKVLENKKFNEDNRITDAKLKADSGSLSRYSLSFNLSYYGPTLGDMGAKDQPNPDGTPGTYETSLGGSFGGRFRIDSSSSINAGAGLKAIHPLHGMERFDTNNPYMGYNISTRLAGVQMRNSISVSAITIPNYTKIGEYGSISYDNSMVYDLGTSHFAIGFDTSFGYYLYNRDYDKKDGKAARYNIAFFPNLKYNFNDKFNINTSMNLSYWNARSRADQYNLQNRTITQRLGLGYAWSRDIYIAPYLNFFPDKLATDATTVNASVIFSVL
jgi:hypothetical protein